MNVKMNVMNLQTDIQWIKNELNDVNDPNLIEAFKSLLKYRRKTKEESSYEISDEHKLILDKRLADHAENPDSGRSWNELKSDLQTKYDL